ncbi:curli-like amyloid fiber formation chaperone CsgH [Aestuariibius sp. 2305UL40-4]|uniref:curli-like amyloid fiber formation chaperone CsgH n=1 Tax=Aestuariibius violaceus TaxID=3234132 RepID=UPI00345E4471
MLKSIFDKTDRRRPLQFGWLALVAILFGGQATAMTDIKCEIERKAVRNGIELRGFVWADHQVDASYSLFVIKEGPSGRSSVSQRGLFRVTSGDPTPVGFVALNAGRADRYTAQLIVESGGIEICRSEI